MAIYRMMGENKDLVQIPVTSFGETGVLERQDLQRILRDKPEILEDGLFILAEEFSNWQGSGRSIDLLGLDATGRLVVVELKRGETGEHMDLQSIRYAAMVSPLTLQQAINAHQAYLDKRGIDEDAEERVNGHLENLDDSQGFSTAQPRIILVSEGFSPELTTSVLWLNDNYGLAIKCIRMQPYRNGEELLVETSQVIPLPETADYFVRIRERENEVQKQRTELGQLVPGGDAFAKSIAQAPEQFQEKLAHIYDWASNLEVSRLASLSSRIGSDRTSLSVGVPGKSALLRIRNKPGQVPIIWFRAGVFRDIAPESIPAISNLIGTDLWEIKNSTGRRPAAITDTLLAALTAAYREANGLPGDGEDGGAGG